MYSLDDYEDDRYPRTMCRKCEESEQRFDEANEFLEEIVRQVYTKGAFDPNQFEHCLDELCFLMNIKLNPSELQIEKKSKITYINDWLSFNQDYLNQLA